MDTGTAVRSALRQFDHRVAVVHPSQWSSATPAGTWSVRDLIIHATDQLRWATAALPSPARIAAAGAAPTGGGGGAGTGVGTDPTADWTAALAQARDVWSVPDFADATVRAADGRDVDPVGVSWWLAEEMTVHTWDLARAVGDHDELPNDLVAAVLDEVRLRQAAGRSVPELGGHPAPGADPRYAPSISVPGCSDDLTELLARLGRHRWWRAAGLPSPTGPVA
ncbi:maleylpyruvate isomerase family mycothiol-dependent enzyme [Nakamurella leprariae]|uniref:Maleylpyruvate isomerase family mycothiol-dependent enzyme n=1 Tax=Nakamurella leprariae TaxID=2803911 RepID=A0A938YE49_9ACTN|nr:maleylpyruvate isomerase family mycothiol-dependent enzyme [Nakamurella leprariae]MBM9468169.1 maleylpyruvate isomerase family mycothiol-dependent enzyme [Nakamurella leprariae]